MAQSSEAVPFEMGDELDSSATLDNTCPDCGQETVATYMDRYSEYEYCTQCDWSDEEETSSREPITRRDRREEG